MDVTTKLQELSATVGSYLNVDGADANECTAVPHKWEELLGLPLVYGNAVDMYDNAPDSDYIKTLNEDTNFPAPGDIIIWHQDPRVGTNQYGHVAVVVTADVNSVTVIEQNSPHGHAVRIHQVPNYAGCTGWLHPRVLDVPVAIPSGPLNETVTVTVDTLDVRDAPSINANGHQANTDDGMVHNGATLHIIDAVTGDDYATEEVHSNIWLKVLNSENQVHYVWSGGTDFPQPVATPVVDPTPAVVIPEPVVETPAPVVPIVENTTPEPQVVAVNPIRIVEITPKTTAQPQVGAIVVDLETMVPVAQLSGTKALDIYGIATVNNNPYLVTQTMHDNGLNHGIATSYFQNTVDTITHPVAPTPPKPERGWPRWVVNFLHFLHLI